MNVACNSLVARNPLARRVWQAKRFEPSHIPGLGLDLDAAYGVLNTIGPDVPATNGQAVRRWLDKSGNGRHFDQATATSQPVLKDGYIYADGVNDQMFGNSSSLNLVSGVGAATVFCVAYRLGSLSATQVPMRVSVASSVATRFGVETSVGLGRVSGRTVDTDAFRYADTPDGLSAAQPFIFYGHADFVLGTLSARLNGGSSGNGALVSSGLTPASLSSVVSLFSNGASLSNFYGGLARVLVWPRALTASELLRVHRYLSATYGIPLA